MKKYMSQKDIVKDEKYPFTKGQLTRFVTNRHKNGLSTSIRKIGKRIYIREDLFDEWIESHVEDEKNVPSTTTMKSYGDITCSAPLLPIHKDLLKKLKKKFLT